MERSGTCRILLIEDCEGVWLWRFVYTCVCVCVEVCVCVCVDGWMGVCVYTN